MNYLVRTIACLFVLCGFAAAAEPAKPGLHYRTITDSSGKTGRYILFVPLKLDPAARPPVLLFLHGSGERGENGLDQLMVGLGPALWKQRTTFPFVTVLPQCSTGGRWNADGPDAALALAALKQTQQELNADPDRVYLTGLSMGGGGTWSIASQDPAMFAAIAPMCSRGDLESASKLAAAHLPVWDFCGDKDRAETVEFSRKMNAALKAAGADARYTEYPEVGHNCWDNAYGTPELYTWLLEQSRSKNRAKTE